MENSLKAIIAILAIGIGASLFLNVYVLTRPSTVAPTYVADMKVTDLNVIEQVMNATENLYYVSATFNLTNLGNSTSALAEIYLKVCDPQGNPIITSPSYRFYYSKTNPDAWVGVENYAMTASTFYWRSSYPNPYAVATYEMTLFYHKPNGVQTHVEVAVYGSISNPQVKFN
jgi:hypothetical protein